MANTKDYSMREMVLDRCFSTGKEFTREELMAIVNKELMQRDMLPVRSRNTFSLDINEMNSKFHKLYGVNGIVFEDRGRKRYYRYRDGIESIYSRELTAEEVGKLHEVRNLLQSLRGMVDMDWLDQMTARFDQRAMGFSHPVASFEDVTAGDAKHFLSLFNAITQKQVMTIEYQRFGLDSKERIIYPYHLKQYRRRWYLFATILDHEYITCFSLDRILSIAKNNTVPFLESTVDFNHFFDDIVGVSHPDNEPVEHIVLKGDRWVEDYLRTLPIHPLQQLESLGNEGCRVTLDLMINNELIQELAFYDDHLLVESPQRLRDKMIKRAQRKLDDYRRMEDFGDNLDKE
ncbi:MAG: WYL domain-containing protein [Prevotella sp.]|nr:WYL domain-containing protein [Prevotella sp.]